MTAENLKENRSLFYKYVAAYVLLANIRAITDLQFTNGNEITRKHPVNFVRYLLICTWQTQV